MPRLPPTTLDQHRRCRSCGQYQALESLDYEGRSVWLQIQHQAKAGELLPPQAELAKQMGWEESRVRKGLEQLKARGYLRGISGRAGHYQLLEGNLRTLLESTQRDLFRATQAREDAREAEKASARLVGKNHEHKNTIRALEKQVTEQQDLIRTLNEAKKLLTNELRLARQTALDLGWQPEPTPSEKK